MLDKCSPWTSTFDFQTMACVLCFGIFICGCDEGNDQALYSREELNIMLVYFNNIFLASH